MFQDATTQNTTVTASGRTGEICPKTGPYRCSTSPVVIVPVKRGTPFPPGPKGSDPAGQPTTWTFVGTSTTTVPTI
jgi:hypothetical protein